MMAVRRDDGGFTTLEKFAVVVCRQCSDWSMASTLTLSPLSFNGGSMCCLGDRQPPAAFVASRRGVIWTDIRDSFFAYTLHPYLVDDGFNPSMGKSFITWLTSPSARWEFVPNQSATAPSSFSTVVGATCVLPAAPAGLQTGQRQPSGLG